MSEYCPTQGGTFRAEETVDAMSIKQAKAVYEYLKGVFA